MTRWTRSTAIVLVLLFGSGCVNPADELVWPGAYATVAGESQLFGTGFGRLSGPEPVVASDLSVRSAYRVDPPQGEGLFGPVWVDAETLDVIAASFSWEQYFWPNFIFNPDLQPLIAWHFVGTVEPGPVEFQGMSGTLDVQDDRVILTVARDHSPMVLRFTPGDSIWPRLVEVLEGDGEGWIETWRADSRELTGQAIAAASRNSTPWVWDVDLPDERHPQGTGFGISLETAIEVARRESPGFNAFLASRDDWTIPQLRIEPLNALDGMERVRWNFTASNGLQGWQVDAVLQRVSALSEQALTTRAEMFSAGPVDGYHHDRYQSRALRELWDTCEQFLQGTASLSLEASEKTTDFRIGGALHPGQSVVATCWQSEGLPPMVKLDARTGHLVGSAGLLR